MLRRLLVPTAAALLAAAITTTVAIGGTKAAKHHSRSDAPKAYSVGLWGDLPYSATQATVGVPNLIADMNAQKLAFTVHDGDLKSGSSPCTDAVYTQGLAYLNSLRAPAAFTPGDNDWTDCDRTAGTNSLERLDHERALFFQTPFTHGQHKLRQQVQSTPMCLGVAGPTRCVENRRWTYGGVTYATLNVQGSCNNLCDVAPDPAEYAARNAANIAWLKGTFASAAAHHSKAVMLIAQANPGFDGSDATRTVTRDPLTLAQTDGQPDGYQEFLVALRDQVVAFRRPVAYVHGDSHYFRIDKPLQNATGVRVENFTRVETYGDNQQNGNNDVNWVKVGVDPSTREVFSYQPQVVPGNRTAVPAP